MEKKTQKASCLSKNLILEKEELNKFERLTLDYGISDASVALGFQFFFIILIGFFPPPIFSILKTNFMYIIALFCLFTIPLVLISIVDIVNNYKILKKKNGESESKDYKLISTLSYYIIPLLFLIYFPTNILEFYIWIITAFALYIGFGKFPLIKYSIELFHFPNNCKYFNKKVVRNISSSVLCLNIALWGVLLAIPLKIYPIAFLLIFFIKYFVHRKYFNDLTLVDFYKNWERSEDFLMRCFKIESLVVVAVAIIFFALDLYGII